MKRNYVIIYETQTFEGRRISYMFPGSIAEMENDLRNILFPETDTDNKIIFAGQIKREFDFTTAVHVKEKAPAKPIS